MRILILALLLAGCATTQPPSSQMPTSGPAYPPSGWVAYCDRAENRGDPAC